MSSLTRPVTATLGCLVLVFSLSALAAEPGDVVARFGDDEIRRDAVDAQARRMGLTPSATEAQRQRIFAAALEQLLDERAIRAELLRLGLGAEESAVESMVDRFKQQAKDNGKDFNAVLAESSRTLEEVREQVALEMTIQAFIRPRMTKNALDRVYEVHRRDLDGTKLRVSHVVLRPDGGGSEEVVARLMRQADEIRQEIVQGRMTFAEAAAMWSVGPSRRVGGDLGWISREGPMFEPFSNAAFKLPKGGVSEPFSTPWGIHIVTVTDVDPGRIGASAVQGKLERLLAQELVRGLVVDGRRRVGVTFLPGTPHFDPATLGEPNERRAVVLGSPER